MSDDIKELEERLRFRAKWRASELLPAESTLEWRAADSLARLLAERDEARTEAFRQNQLFIAAEAERDKLAARLEELTRERDEAKAGAVKAHENFITAWEALPGGRDYDVSMVQKWLVDTMKPAVDRARAFLHQGDSE